MRSGSRNQTISGIVRKVRINTASVLVIGCPGDVMPVTEPLSVTTLQPLICQTHLAGHTIYIAMNPLFCHANPDCPR